MLKYLPRIFCGATFLSCCLVVFGCQRSESPKLSGGETHVATSARREEAASPIPLPPKELITTQSAFTEVARKVTPVVVNISTARTTTVQEIDPFFREFFGDMLPQAPSLHRKEQSLGSGFILTPDGFILTNAHVVKGAQEIRVKLSDNQVYPGRIIATDPKTDIAVLKIDAKVKLTPAVLGNSDRLQVGQWALAIGNPFGLDRTVTVGVISATGRANVGIEDYEDFIQTDASINPGNSGGPLLNIYGEVIGINTAIVASGQGIGFAIPINLARQIATQLMETGNVTRGWLGVSIQPLTPELARSFNLEESGGALINQVVDASPAAKAGLKNGDILLNYDGKKVLGVRELQLLVASTPIGRTVPVEIIRNGKRSALSVVITAQPEGKRSALKKSVILGLSVVSTPNDQGVRIERLDPESVAATAGVRPDDIIIGVNRHEVRTLDDFNRLVAGFHPGDNVVLLLQRGNISLFVAFIA